MVIAACAAYFSIIGLTLLFVGSATSIIIMGSALELGKLVTVSFLHQQWERINFLLKTYLILASIILSAITSVGIYGYLANGYNATSLKVKSLEQSIEGNNRVISQTKKDIEALLVIPDSTAEVNSLNSSKDKFTEQQLSLITQKEKRISELQASIATERNKAVNDLAVAKNNLEEETKKEIDQIKLYNDRLVILDKEIQIWMDQGQGGLFKQNGLEKARETRNAQERERNQIDTQIKDKQNTIDKLRLGYELKTKELTDDLNKRIKTIEDRISAVEQDITKDKQGIEAYQIRITNELANKANLKESKIENNKAKTLEKEQYIQQLEKTNTELQGKIVETDVGTFKFVAKSVGLELDKTVNWFIWSIMLVFDPLAVTLIICFNHLLKHRKKKIIIPPVPSPEPAPVITPALSTITPIASAETFTVTVSSGQVVDDDDDPNTPNQYERLMRIIARQRGGS
jgi:hypothetical protein